MTRKICLLVCLLLLALPALSLAEDQAAVSGETGLPALSLAEGYQIIIVDEAELLTPLDELNLRRAAAELSAYGTVAFYSTNERGGVDEKAERFFDRFISTERSFSGVVFMVDMYNREIYIFTRGLIEKRVGRAGAYAITDNVYKLAGAGDYAGCAAAALEGVLRLVKGQRVFSPMRLACNLLLALNMALVAGYLILRRTSVHPAPKKKSSKMNEKTTVSMTLGTMTLLSVRRRLREVNAGGPPGGGPRGGGGFRSSGGGGGFRSSGGFHSSGGGGHSAGGSGGGHRF